MGTSKLVVNQCSYVGFQSKYTAKIVQIGQWLTAAMPAFGRGWVQHVSRVELVFSRVMPRGSFTFILFQEEKCFLDRLKLHQSVFEGCLKKVLELKFEKTDN